jgi:DNA-directed RNA polymerase I, II, and III subunit RPABC1
VDVPSIRYRIVFELGARFKSSNIKKLLEREDVSTFVLVVREVPTSTALKGLEAAGREIQLFKLDELQYNVSRHALVPPHESLRDDKDVAEVLDRYQLRNRWHLPLILSTDPMARYLGLRHGDVVRITRPSPSAGAYTLYRCCMKA